MTNVSYDPVTLPDLNEFKDTLTRYLGDDAHPLVQSIINYQRMGFEQEEILRIVSDKLIEMQGIGHVLGRSLRIRMQTVQVLGIEPSDTAKAA